MAPMKKVTPKTPKVTPKSGVSKGVNVKAPAPRAKSPGVKTRPQPFGKAQNNPFGKAQNNPLGKAQKNPFGKAQKNPYGPMPSGHGF